MKAKKTVSFSILFQCVFTNSFTFSAAEVASEIEKANIVHGIVFKGNTVGTGAAKRIGKALATKKEFKVSPFIFSSDCFTGYSCFSEHYGAICSLDV